MIRSIHSISKSGTGRSSSRSLLHGRCPRYSQRREQASHLLLEPLRVVAVDGGEGFLLLLGIEDRFVLAPGQIEPQVLRQFIEYPGYGSLVPRRRVELLPDGANGPGHL